MNPILYYLILASRIEEARQYAPAEGEPNEVFQVRLSTDGTKAIAQARWTDTAAMDAIGTCLGELRPDGLAPQAVYDELAKPEWN